MGARGTRLAFGAGGLVLLWIAVYWWWGEGGGSQLVTFDGTPPKPARHDAVRVSVERTDPPADLPVSRAPADIEDPTFRWYTPARGETWESIAYEQLGDPALADAVRRANPLRSGGAIEPGRDIRIPADPANIQGRPTRQAPERIEPKPDLGEAKPPPQDLRMTEYTVQDGDTLGEISKRFYGTSLKWQRIFDHNKGRLNLSGPESIRGGQVLQIPPEGAEG